MASNYIENMLKMSISSVDNLRTSHERTNCKIPSANLLDALCKGHFSLCTNIHCVFWYTNSWVAYESVHINGTGIGDTVKDRTLKIACVLINTINQLLLKWPCVGAF